MKHNNIKNIHQLKKSKTKRPIGQKPILPIEIIALIISKIENRQTLKNTALVCKEWYDLTQPHFCKFKFALKCGYNHVVLLTPSGRLFIWGSNAQGQLGVNDRLHFLYGYKISTPHRLNLKAIHSIQTIFVGKFSKSTFLYTKSNKLLAWGYNSDGQLGLGIKKNQIILTPTELNYKNYGIDHIKKLYLGQYHTILFDQSNRLFTCGSNMYGQLGLGREIGQKIHIFKEINLKNYGIKVIKQISVGAHHNLLLAQTGELFSWGLNTHNALGRTSNQDIPGVVDTLPLSKNDICKIFAGEQSNFILTHSNELYAWGNNKNFQLGIISRNRQYTISKVKINSHYLNNLQGIYLSRDCTYILTKSGKLLASGTTPQNQFKVINKEKDGNSPISSKIVTAKLSSFTDIRFDLALKGKILAIFPGFDYNLLLTEYGDIYGWGNNYSGQLGLGEKFGGHIVTPKFVENLRFFGTIGDSKIATKPVHPSVKSHTLI